MSGDAGARAVAVARSWIGTPYRHQAACRGAGTDCLGLIRGIWREVQGCEPETVPAYTWDWAEAGREESLWQAARRTLVEKPPEAMAPGDVLLFRMREGAVAKHLGLLSAPQPEARFIHAYAGHGVIENALSRPWARRVVACFSFPGGCD